MSRHTIALLAATVSLRLLLFNRFWHLAMSLPTSSDAPKGAPHRTNSDSSPQFAQNPSGLNFRERASGRPLLRPSVSELGNCRVSPIKALPGWICRNGEIWAEFDLRELSCPSQSMSSAAFAAPRPPSSPPPSLSIQPETVKLPSFRARSSS